MKIKKFLDGGILKAKSGLIVTPMKSNTILQNLSNNKLVIDLNGFLPTNEIERINNPNGSFTIKQKFVDKRNNRSFWYVTEQFTNSASGMPINTAYVENYFNGTQNVADLLLEQDRNINNMKAVGLIKKKSGGKIPKGLFGMQALALYATKKARDEAKKLKLNNYTVGDVPIETVDWSGNKDTYTKPYVYNTTVPVQMANDTGNLSHAPMTIINLDGDWKAETPRLSGNIRSVKYTNGNKYFTLTKDVKTGKEMLYDYYDGNAYFDDTQLDQNLIKRNIYPRLNPKYKFGGTLNYFFSKGKRLYF